MIKPILAQLENVPDSALKNFVLIIAGALACAYYAKEIFTSGKKKREVSFELESVTKDEFDKHVDLNKDEHDKIFSKIGGVERGGREEVDKKITKLSTELNATNALMHETKGEMKQLTSQLVLIQQELAKR